MFNFSNVFLQEGISQEKYLLQIVISFAFFVEPKERQNNDTSKCFQGDGISTVSPLPPGPPEQLSGVAVVIIIAVRTPVIFFISLKCQRSDVPKMLMILEHFFCRLGYKLSSCFSYLPKGK